MVVVGKLSKREEHIPVILSFPNKDTQVLLKLLVNAFSLPISLRVIGCGRCSFNPKQSVQLLHELSNELWASIRYDLAWETVKLPDIVQVEVSGASSRNGGHSLSEVRPLTHRINGYHNGIVAP